MKLHDFFSDLLDKAKKRGVAYTSLDAMKLFAVVNMTADHVGAYFLPDHMGGYFFPDHLWWRAIGRITFPVWFFLVGYTRSRALPRSLWVFAFLLAALHPLVGRNILPLNALVSIILCRFFLNACSDRNLLPKALPLLIILCVAITPLTNPLFEYGGLALLYAIFGRMTYLKEKRYFRLLACSCYLAFVGFQFNWFEFTGMQALYVMLGTMGVVWWLATFKNTTLLQDWTTARWKIFITLLSRNTLVYYFAHRALFQILARIFIGHTH